MTTQHEGQGAGDGGRGKTRTLAPRPSPLAPTSGFSLVEAMVVVGIFTIIGAALVAVAGAGHQFWAVGDAADQVQAEFRRAMNYLEQDIKEGSAKRVCDGDTPGRTSCGTNDALPSSGTGATGITFKVPVDVPIQGNGVLDANGNCCDWGANGDTNKNIRYALNTTAQPAMGGQLVRCVVTDTGADTTGCPVNSSGGCSNTTDFEDCLIVGNHVTKAEFWKTGNSLITVELTTKKRARSSGTGTNSGWEPSLADIKAQIDLRNP